MGKLLYQSWAKVLAYLLMLILLAGTVLCLTAVLDMHFGGMELKFHPLFIYRAPLEIGAVLCPLGCLFLLGFSLAATGRWEGYEGIHLTWLDRIPLEIDAAVLLLCFYGFSNSFFTAAFSELCRG